MNGEEARLEALLRDVPPGRLTLTGPAAPGSGFDARTDGRGLLEAYTPLPGVEAAFTAFLAGSARFRHPAPEAALELFRCRAGRVGWVRAGGMSVFLGVGEMSLQAAAHCARSSMSFPLGYAEGLSLFLDLRALAGALPPLLARAGVNPLALGEALRQAGPSALPAGPAMDAVFSPQ